MVEGDEVIITSKQELLDVVKMSARVFDPLVERYSFERLLGISAKINGRYHLTKRQALLWYKRMQHERCRHPEARRMRPMEPPDIDGIVGR